MRNKSIDENDDDAEEAEVGVVLVDVEGTLEDVLLEDVDEGEAESCHQGHDVANHVGCPTLIVRATSRLLDIVVVDAEAETSSADGESDVVELLVAYLEEEDGHDDGAWYREVLEHHDGSDRGEVEGVHEDY